MPVQRYSDLFDVDVINAVKSGENILVGVSGGPDSIALLLGLHEISSQKRWVINAVYVDHKSRTDAVAREKDLITKLCEQLKVAVYLEEVKGGKNSGQSLETFYRDERYACYGRVADFVGAQTIFLGHTADDLVESFIYQLSRWGHGSSVQFKPITSSNGLVVVRPLWRTWKSSILDSLRDSEQPYSIDETNHDDTISVRNRIRMNILPYLRQQLNPKIDEALLRCALSFEVLSSFCEHLNPPDPKDNVLRLADLDSMDILEREYFFDKWVKRATGKTLPPQSAVHIRRKIREKTSGLIQLAGRRYLVLDGEAAWFSYTDSRIALTQSYLKQHPGRYIVAQVDPHVITPGGKVNLLDAQGLVWPSSWHDGRYLIRNRRPGDFLSSKKLKKHLNAERVPFFVRDYLLVIEEVETGQIAAILGLTKINRRLGYELPEPEVRPQHEWKNE